MKWCILGFWRFILCLHRIHVLYYLTVLFCVIPLCTMFMQNKNTQSNTALFQKDHHMFQFILNHPEAFIQNLWNTAVLQTLCTIIQWDCTNSVFKNLTLFCSTCKFFNFFLKFCSNVVPRWKYIFIKTKILNQCEKFSTSMWIYKPKRWTGINFWIPILSYWKNFRTPSISGKVHTYYLFLYGCVFYNEYHFYSLFYIAQCYRHSR